ncbi:MAG: ribbon-helix-helix domain-containing protein [Actinomycetota bacterium]|nr:ribbon-helix-helix domain-containing protein [Actinomycetota bacterium]
MKRLQISIEEELDDALTIEAARLKVSKAALIRGFVRERLGGERADNPVDELVGDIDDEAGDIDSVVYGA